MLDDKQNLTDELINNSEENKNESIEAQKKNETELKKIRFFKNIR